MKLTKEESLLLYGQSIERVSVDADGQVTRELIQPEDFYKMKTQNELILSKLIELGYLTFADEVALKSVQHTHKDFFELKLNSIIFDSLVSECG